MFTFIEKETTPPPLDLVRNLFRQTVEGVKYLHSKSIAHRDLKPENLLLNKDHTVVKITDFGTSRIILPGAKAGTLCGTLGYMGLSLFFFKRQFVCF